jgi:hypothetical protein
LRGLATGAALLVLTTAAPVVASPSSPSAKAAGCGGVQQVSAQQRTGSLPPLAIGDSTMLLALPDLSHEGFEANARGCRQYPEALALISGLARAGRLPHLIVIALGANGQIEPGNVEQALRILGPSRVLVLLTPRELGGGSGSDAQLVRAEGRRYGGRLIVLDWVAYSASHPDWFEPDGLHVNPTGAAGLARLIGRVLPIAAPPPRTRTPRCAPPPDPSVPTSGQLPTPEVAVPMQATSVSPPGSALHGVAVRSHHGVLLVASRSGHLEIPLTNENTVAVAGLVRVELAGAAEHRLIAAACVGVAAVSNSHLAVRLSAETVADAELLARFQVRVLFTLATPEGLSGTIAGTFVLRSESQ